MSTSFHYFEHIRLMTADDHVIVRTGLQMMLALELGIKDVYEASSCAEVMSHLRQYKPSHLIIDMIFKDGNAIEILPTVYSLFPKLKIMVYSMLPAEVYMPTLQRYGVQFFLNKEASQEKTLETLKRFMSGSLGNDEKTLVSSESNPFSRLSPRELEVLHYLLQGATVAATAAALNLHSNTVSTLKNRLLEKIGVQNLKGLMDAAALHGIVY